MSAYHVSPITIKSAIRWSEQTHRHLPKVEGGLFAASVKQGTTVVGVAIAGRPARVWEGTGRFIVTRCAALPGLTGHGDHAAPVCTMLYGALCRAGRALGYTEVWTYSLPDEDGRSIRAAGFLFMGYSRAEEWTRAARPRAAAACAGRKGRWARGLTRAAHLLLQVKAKKIAARTSSPERIAA